MSEPAKYISGRTVQEQMQNLIQYVDVRSGEVAEPIAERAEAAAERAEAAAAVTVDCVKKTGNAIPQVISGTGGLQIAGDLSVGGDLTVSADGHVHMDASDIEVANMAIEKSGSKTVLSNDDGIIIASRLEVQNTTTEVRNLEAVNGNRLQNDLDAYASMVRTTGNQKINGIKEIAGNLLFNEAFVKNTIGVAMYQPLFKMESGISAGRQMNATFIVDRRNASSGCIVSVYWNGNTLTKIELAGTTPKFAIMTNPDGEKWLCIYLSQNDAVNIANFGVVRSSGFNDRLYPRMSNEGIDTTQWTIEVESS